jgi:hypothetical protein
LFDGELLLPRRGLLLCADGGALDRPEHRRAEVGLLREE